MATKASPRGRNEPEPRPIIVKKVIEAGHGGHHGGAWKVAYADFVTAMMAFFLLMWLLGMTDEEKRKGIADYFTPTLVEYRQNSAGSNGFFGGDSLISKDNYPHKATQTGNRSIVIPKAATGGPEAGDTIAQDRQRFEALKKALEQRMASDPELKALKPNVRMVETREGLRIDLVDEADFTMFALSTDSLLPRARKLIGVVARVIEGVPNQVIVRGHTDALPYASAGPRTIGRSPRPAPKPPAPLWPDRAWRRSVLLGSRASPTASPMSRPIATTRATAACRSCSPGARTKPP
jgi:chemotaxis protein MotB